MGWVPSGGGSLSPAAHAASDRDRKSTRLNSSHSQTSYAVFCLKKKRERLVLQRVVPPLVRVRDEARRLHDGSEVGPVLGLRRRDPPGVVVGDGVHQVVVAAHADELPGREVVQREVDFFFTDAAPPDIYTLSLHDALPI